MRSVGLIVSLYCNDYSDHYPYAGDELHDHRILGVGRFRIGGAWGLESGQWSAMFPDEWQGHLWNPALMCPRQRRFDESIEGMDGFGLRDGGSALPWFWWSKALWLDPSTMFPGAEWSDFRPRAIGVYEAVFPAKKSLAYEQIAFCAEEPNMDSWIQIGQTPYASASMLQCDGSVVRFRRADMLPSVRIMPPNETIGGIRGIDIP